MAIDLRPVPDFARRRALQGHWSVALERGLCAGCGEMTALNLLSVCQPCNFREKVGSLTVVAAPWGLREVRREFGHSGETTRDSEYQKQRKHEESERLVANSVSLETYQKRIADQLG